jgi:hypothetical protein
MDKVEKNNLTQQNTVGFEVLTAVSMKMAVFWVVAPFSMVEVYQCFRGPCWLHHQGDDLLMPHETYGQNL